MNNLDNKKENLIFETGDKMQNYFTGDAYVKMLMTNPEYDCMIYNVTFEPGARNFWHKHSIGQILLVTHGEGYYQEKGKSAQLLKAGDVVEIPAKAEHWHGAAPNSTFIHVGITPKSSKNKVEWLSHVTDEEYNSL
jgi:quercetin dioxygenase-like cupin family protein